jgi:hypothetical protein
MKSRWFKTSLVYVWASPTTTLGLFIALLTWITGGHVQVVEGVVEAACGFAAFFLKHCTFLRDGASAMTLGHVVLARDTMLLNLTRNHERVHVRQCERWGPLFLPAYAIGSLLALVRGGNVYYDNPFEREAYAIAP